MRPIFEVYIYFTNSIVHEIELEMDKGRYVYKVEGYDNSFKYEIKLEASTGKAIKTDWK